MNNQTLELIITLKINKLENIKILSARKDFLYFSFLIKNSIKHFIDTYYAAFPELVYWIEYKEYKERLFLVCHNLARVNRTPAALLKLLP